MKIIGIFIKISHLFDANIPSFKSVQSIVTIVYYNSSDLDVFNILKHYRRPHRKTVSLSKLKKYMIMKSTNLCVCIVRESEVTERPVERDHHNSGSESNMRKRVIILLSADGHGPTICHDDISEKKRRMTRQNCAHRIQYLRVTLSKGNDLLGWTDDTRIFYDTCSRHTVIPRQHVIITMLLHIVTIHTSSRLGRGAYYLHGRACAGALSSRSATATDAATATATAVVVVTTADAASAVVVAVAAFRCGASPPVVFTSDLCSTDCNSCRFVRAGCRRMTCLRAAGCGRVGGLRGNGRRRETHTVCGGAMVYGQAVLCGWRRRQRRKTPCGRATSRYPPTTTRQPPTRHFSPQIDGVPRSSRQSSRRALPSPPPHDRFNTAI
ncbi:hypothetical protein QTP88_018289 [Uroleucon formosanum]